MHLEIRKPELQALITQRMATGRFRDVEDALMQALQSSSPSPTLPSEPDTRTGADLIAAMQAMPYKDVDIEPYRPHMPVRDVVL